MKNIEKIEDNQSNILISFSSDFLDYFHSVNEDRCNKFINDVYLNFNQKLLIGGKVYEKNNQIKSDESLKSEVKTSFFMVLGYALQRKKGKASTEAFYKGYVNKLLSDKNYYQNEVNSLVQHYSKYSDQLKLEEALIIDPSFRKNKKIQNQQDRIRNKTLKTLTDSTDFLDNSQNISYLLDVNTYPNGIETIQDENIVNGEDFLGIIDKITSDSFVVNDRDLFVLLHRRKKIVQGEKKYRNWKKESTQELTSIPCNKLFEINDNKIESFKSGNEIVSLIGLELEYLFLGDDGNIDFDKMHNFLSDIDYKKFINTDNIESEESNDLNKVEILEDAKNVLGDYYNESKLCENLSIDKLIIHSFNNNKEYKGTFTINNGYSILLEKSGNIYNFCVLNLTFPIADVSIDVENNIIHEGESYKIRELKSLLSLYVTNRTNHEQSEIDIKEDIKPFFIQNTARQLYFFIQSFGNKYTKITDFISKFRSFHRDEIASPEKPKDKTKLTFDKFNDKEFLEFLFDTKIKKITGVKSLSDKQELLFHFLDSSTFKSMLNLYQICPDVNMLSKFHKEFEDYAHQEARFYEYKIYEYQKEIDKVLDASNHSFLKYILQKKDKLLFIFQNAPENIKESYRSKISAKITYVSSKMEDTSITTGNENIHNVFRFIELLDQIGMETVIHRVIKGINEVVDNIHSKSIKKITFLLQSLLKNQTLILNILGKLGEKTMKYDFIHLLNHKIIDKIKNHNQSSFSLQVFQQGIDILGHNKSPDTLNALFNQKLNLIKDIVNKTNDPKVSSYNINDLVKEINVFLSSLNYVYIPNETLVIFQNFITSLGTVENEKLGIIHTSIIKYEGDNKVVYVQRGMKHRYKSLKKLYDIDDMEDIMIDYGDDLSKVPSTIFTKNDCNKLEELERELCKLNKETNNESPSNQIDTNKLNVEVQVNILKKKKSDQEKFHNLLEIQLEMNQTFGRQEKNQTFNAITKRFKKIVYSKQGNNNNINTQAIPDDLYETLKATYLSREVLQRIKNYKNSNKKMVAKDLNNIFTGSYKIAELFKGFEINQDVLSILENLVEKIIFNKQLDKTFSNLNEFISVLEYINGDDIEKIDREKLELMFFEKSTGHQTRVKIFMYLVDKNLLDDELINKFLDNILTNMDIIDHNNFRNGYYYFVKTYRDRDDIIGMKIRDKIKDYQTTISYFDDLYS